MALALAGTTMISAQRVYVTEGQQFTTDVTNEGVAVVSSDQCQPYFLWDPITNEYTMIGGISAGNGIGGVARFSPDEKRVYAVTPSENITINSNWQKVTVHKYADYDVFDIDRSLKGSNLNTAALLVKQGGGIMFLSSSNNGLKWLDSDGLEDESLVPHQMSVLGWHQFIAADSENGPKILESKGNFSWYERDVRPEGNTTEIKSFTAIANTEWINAANCSYMAVGYEAEDGSYGVWCSSNLGAMDENWNKIDPVFEEATGVEGIPTGMYCYGETFYMTTANGKVQKSEDAGKTWTTIYTSSDELGRMHISSADNYAIICGVNLLITTDGGETWNKKTILPAGINPFSVATWNDLYWLDDKILIVGSEGLYESNDNGNTFAKVNINLSDDDVPGDLNAVSYRYDGTSQKGTIVIGSDSAKFFSKNLDAPVFGYSPAYYDVDDCVWTLLDNSGYNTQDVYGSIHGVSADGKHIVGGVYTYDQDSQSVLHCASVWSDTGELTILPNMYASIHRASTAIATNYDGSIIGGWQDHHGPWYASLWKRGADGVYNQELMTYGKAFEDINTNDYEDMSSHLMGQIQYITPDGKWIGGRGAPVYASQEAWIWNEDEGYIFMGTDGTVSGITAEGDFACGWGDTGLSGWVWDKENGYREINRYVEDINGTKDADIVMISSYAMSPNGRYLCGWGMNGMEKHGWVLDRFYEQSGVVGIEAEQVKAAIYPNPVANELHVDVPFDGNEINTVITITNMQGMVCRTVTDCHQSNVINVSDLAEGLYIVNVNARGHQKAFKVIVRH